MRGAVRGKIASDGKDNIRGRAQEMAIEAKKLPDNPFYPVPPYRRFDPVNADPQSIFPAAVEAMDDSQLRPPDPFPVLVNLAVFPRSTEQKGLGKRQLFHAWGKQEAGRSIGQTPVPDNLLPTSDGQTVTTFGPAPVDYRLSGLGFHSGPKAMGPVTLEITGLKSSLAHFVPFYSDTAER